MATTISRSLVKGPSALYCLTTIRVAAGAVAAAMEQRDGRGQRDDVRAGKVQGNKGDIHQRGGDHRLRNAHGHGAASHVLQGAEPELVADDEAMKPSATCVRMP